MAAGAGLRDGSPAELSLPKGGIPFLRLHKLGVYSRRQALIFAVRRGLVKVGAEATRARPAARRADRLKKTRAPRASAPYRLAPSRAERSDAAQVLGFAVIDGRRPPGGRGAAFAAPLGPGRFGRRAGRASRRGGGGG